MSGLSIEVIVYFVGLVDSSNSLTGPRSVDAYLLDIGNPGFSPWFDPLNQIKEPKEEGDRVAITKEALVLHRDTSTETGK